MEVDGRVVDRDVIDAVLDLASVPVVLPLDACGLLAAFGSACFVDATDGVRVGLLGGDKFVGSGLVVSLHPKQSIREIAVAYAARHLD